MRLRPIVSAILVLAAFLAATAVILGIRNGTFSGEPFTFISIAMMVAYAAVGTLLLTLAILFVFVPGVLVYPAIVLLLWMGAALLYRAYKLSRRRSETTAERNTPARIKADARKG